MEGRSLAPVLIGFVRSAQIGAVAQSRPREAHELEVEMHAQQRAERAGLA